MTADLRNKVVLITGCNVGIGKVTALKFAQQGAKIIMGCRNMETGKQAQEEIKKQSENENVVLKKLDLGSLQSVREFSEEVLKEEEKIDLLINNAGIMGTKFGLTVDGYEQQFAVNHLGHFLLTNLLLELLKKAESARVIVLASTYGKLGLPNFDDVNYEKTSYRPYKSYDRSKLANVLFANELARRLEGTNVTTYSVHPGVVKTELYRDQKSITKFFMAPFRVFMKTPEQGAATTLYCALEEGIEQHSGLYFADSKLASFPGKGFDEESAKNLWELSEELVKLKEPALDETVDAQDADVALHTGE
ncbi:retinol dehydrogenase 11-like [Clytia hemisphaerica]|uniref:Uncharacterized protein n=1 Tax=Clytia hemisphaerica TaxID=252671 RepID=A0A7M5UQD9_9CNID